MIFICILQNLTLRSRNLTHRALELEAEVRKQEEKISTCEFTLRAAILNGNAGLVLDILRTVCLRHGVNVVAFPTDVTELGDNFKVKYLR